MHTSAVHHECRGRDSKEKYIKKQAMSRSNDGDLGGGAGGACPTISDTNYRRAYTTDIVTPLSAPKWQCRTQPTKKHRLKFKIQNTKNTSNEKQIRRIYVLRRARLTTDRPVPHARFLARRSKCTFTQFTSTLLIFWSKLPSLHVLSAYREQRGC